MPEEQAEGFVELFSSYQEKAVTQADLQRLETSLSSKIDHRVEKLASDMKAMEERLRREFNSRMMYHTVAIITILGALNFLT